MRLSILLAVLGGIAVCPTFVNGETCPNTDGTEAFTDVQAANVGTCNCGGPGKAECYLGEA